VRSVRHEQIEENMDQKFNIFFQLKKIHMCPAKNLVLSCPAGEGFNFCPVRTAPQDKGIGAAGRTG
jgi:hypothetical protein